jgi:phage shock protein PspC (stress-responsive transcriptional regulator)
MSTFPSPEQQPDDSSGTPVRRPGPKRLVRSRDNRVVGGVCAGVADYLGIDVTLVRLVTVLGTVFGMGTLLVAYVVAWLLLPEE